MLEVEHLMQPEGLDMHKVAEVFNGLFVFVKRRG